MIASSTGEREEVRDLLGDLAQTDFPTTKAIRRTLACLADLSRYGLDNLRVREVIGLLKINRIQTIGYREYLYEVLRDRANRPTGQCRLWQNGEEIEVQSSYWESQSLVVYLTHLANAEGLESVPDRVEFQDDGTTRCI
jgi:hypothetical protein